MVFYIIAGVVGLLIGFIVALSFASGAMRRRQGEARNSIETERRILEEQHNQLLQEKDQIILHARAEVNHVMAELAEVRQQAETQIATIRQEMEAAVEERLRANDNQAELEQLREQIAGQTSELEGLRQTVQAKEAEAEEARHALAAREPEFARLTAELNEAKVSLAAVERTHEVTLAAKQSEFERVLQEKDASSTREREMLTTQVQTQLEEQRRMFAQAEQAMMEKLSNVSDRSLRDATQQFLRLANETFDKANRRESFNGTSLAPSESFEDMLQPVREALERLERQNQLLERRREGTFDAIEKGIQQLTSEAVQLANALRKPATQGAWGEMTITTILENAGLISGEHFFLQDSGSDNKKRTDVVLKLPQGRTLVIDSSVPLDAFWDGMNASGEETRAIRMKAHARLVREHVKELGAAYHWAAYDSLPDCVIMFLPTEAAYFSAMEADPSLLKEAKDSGVYLANPMTVLNMAHIAAYVLADDRVRQNAQEIKQLGSELYERLRMFGEHFTNVGQNLKQSVDSYNKALGWIDRNVMPTARKMQLLGTAKGKAMTPPTHIDKAVKSFQNPDMRELPLELTYDDSDEK